jgi:hypothetical protein
MPRRRALLSDASAAAAALLVAAACGCVAFPAADLEAARRAMTRAAEADGAVRAPELCGPARAALAHAEAEAAVQARRPPLSRNYEPAAALAIEARRAAEACAARAGAVLARARRDASRRLADLERAIERARALARHLPPRHAARSGVLRAEIALGEGRTSQARLQHERALEAAGRGLAETRAVIADIDRFFESVRADPRAGRWRRWVKETVRDSRRSGRPAILVDKLRRQLLVVRGDEELATYNVDLGISGIQSKVQEGDEATPEGRYRVTEVRGPGRTRYHRALMLNYPNPEDVANLRRLQRAGKVPHSQEPGGLIEIHGKGGRGVDWTQGCVALDNEDMDDLVRRVGVGTPVTIVGTIPEGALP